MKDEIQQAQQVINTVVDFLVNYAFQVVGAVVILVLGFIVGKSVYSFLIKVFEKRDLDPTLSGFLAGAAKVIILIFAGIVALGKFGISITPFVAALGGLVFGASFAIQGPLSNYGAGFVIIVTRPFVLGDTISVAGVNGIVEDISLGATVLSDEDNVAITIPNKQIVGEIIHNSKTFKIVEEVVGISYESDPEQAIEIIKKSLEAFHAVTNKPEPRVGIQEFADSSINLGVRYWVPTKEYYRVRYDVNFAIYKNLKEEKVDIPFPQRDIHIVSRAGHVENASS